MGALPRQQCKGVNEQYTLSLRPDERLSRLASTVSAARASRSLASLLRMRVCTSFNDRSRCSTLALPMAACRSARASRSEEHTSELQSLMRISYAVFCLKKKTNKLPERSNLNNINDETAQHTSPTQYTNIQQNECPMA